MWQKKVREFFWSCFFLPNGVCPICGKVLFRTRSFLCALCFEDLLTIEMQTCRYCGKPLFTETLPFCGDCGKLEDPIFSGGFAWLHYNDAGKKLVHGLKFGNKPHLGIWMGQEMAVRLGQFEWIWEIDAIIPVPLYFKRQEERGYNQSEKLAKGIQEGLRSVSIDLPVWCDTVMRCRDTPHQMGLNRKERFENLKGAFVVAEPDAIRGKKLLLVDDVNTTGTTLRACADTLKKAGARAVFVATCAGVQ
ncbi:MAG: ComF family protein [Eubacterium sp.]